MVNYSKKTLDKKEKHIKEMYEALKFKDDIKIETLKDLFNQLFNEKHNNATYLLDGKCDCTINRGRSYYDAYRLCMNYFPELSFAEMYTTLRKYIKLGNPNYMNYSSYWNGVTSCFFTCGTVGRAVFDGVLKFK